MTTTLLAITDSDIRAAVIAKGYADASVVRQYVKPRPETFDIDQGGIWFVLFVTYKDGMEPVCWGRRRTMQELLAMAQRGPMC